MKARTLAWLLPGGVVAGLAAALIDAAVKGGLLFLLAAGAALALRNASAATRHFVWMVAIACALSMPLLSVCLPQWRVLPRGIGREAAAREIGLRTAVHRPLPAV